MPETGIARHRTFEVWAAGPLDWSGRQSWCRWLPLVEGFLERDGSAREGRRRQTRTRRPLDHPIGVPLAERLGDVAARTHRPMRLEDVRQRGRRDLGPHQEAP